MDPGQLYSQSTRQRTMPAQHQPDPSSSAPASNQSQRQAPTPAKTLSSSIFKSKKPDAARPPDNSSPKLPKLLTKGEQRRGSGAELDEHVASPINIPLSPLSGTHQRRLGGANSFNNHYRSISKSMNDLGSIFSRGRSPPNRESSPRRPSVIAEGKRSKDKDMGAPIINSHGDGADRILKEGWLNMVDSHSIKKGPLREAWRLQQAIVYGHHLMLYKPPSNLQVKAFDVTLPSTNAPRPATAPTSGMAALNVSSLKHKATSTHPDLVLSDDGMVQGGTVEALCHEILFGKSDGFAKDAALSMPAWTAPETGLSIMSEYVHMDNVSKRITLVLQTIMDRMAGLLLEPAVTGSAKLLVEKGVTPYDPKGAKKLREQIEYFTTTLSKRIPRPPHLEIEQVVYPHAPRVEGGFASTLTAAEFLQLQPEEFAGQLHYFHREFLQNWHPAQDLSVLLRAPHSPPTNYRYPLIFSNSNPHFITERVFAHVLTGDAAATDRYRAAVITQWLKVSQILNIRGDFVGWLAITTALLSPALLRLQETWSKIDPQLIETLVSSGKDILIRIERRKFRQMVDGGDELLIFGPDDIGFDAPADDTIPYFGDLTHAMDEVYAAGGRAININAAIEGVEKMVWTLKHSEKYAPRPIGKSKTKSMPAPDPEYQKLFRALNYNKQDTPAVNSAAFFELSLGCEASSTGMYLQSHYHERLPLDYGANLPLIFTEVLSRFSLFDREDAVALSGANFNRKTGSSPLSPSLSSHGSSHSPLSQGQQAGGRPAPLRRTRSFPPSRPPARTTGYDELDFTTRERTALLHSVDQSILGPIRDVAGVNQQIFYSKDEELVLKAITDDESRPASVVESTNQRTSIASRRLSSQFQATNSPRHSTYDAPVSPRADQFHLASGPMPVVAKGGTLERLVDILVLGVDDFSRRMKKGESEEPPHLSMDMNVFTITFFATFRSYCSPVVLLDYLKKRLTGAKSAAAAAESDGSDYVFPDWTGVDNVDQERINWILVAKIHIGILEALNLWVKEFFVDFHNDQGLTEHLLHFLRVAAKEIAVWENVAEDEEVLAQRARQIQGLWDELRNNFSEHLFTPLTYRGNDGLRGRKRLTVPSSGGLRELDQFIDKLDYSARVAFKAVRLVDWMAAFEIFESQSTDPLGFFLPKVSLLHGDDELIQDIFFLLPRLRRTSDPEKTLLSVLPRPIRDIFQLHTEISEWVAGQIVDPTIDADSRSRRIVAFLKTLAICRKRMANLDMHDKSDQNKRSAGIPSFVESVIASGLTKPEVRMFSHAWSNAAKDTVGPVANIDTLELIIPVITTDDNSRMRPLMPCAGWLVERMLEIVCYVPNMLVESNRLINFDKRRYVYNLVNNITAMGNAANTPSNGLPRGDDLPANFSLTFETDKRTIKDIAARENQYSKSAKSRVFWKLFFQEQEKLRRDKAQRDVIERVLRDAARANFRKQPPVPVEIPAKLKTGKRLGVNTFIKAVRPISMALTNTRSLPYHPGRTVSPFDLPPAKGMEHGRKPAHYIDLSTIQSIACGKNSKDRLMWKIRSESGTAYLFQAPSEQELGSWLKVCAGIRGIQVSDGNAESISALTMHAPSKGIPQKVFGTGLSELCARDGTKIPLVVEMLLSEIEARGLEEVGIYRVGGALASINALITAFDQGEDVRMDDDRWYDINAVAGTLKRFMRELPEPIFDEHVLSHLKDATGDSEPQTPTDAERRIIRYREIMLQQPPHLYHFLRRLFLHLSLIESHSDVNKMTAINLAIVFCMNIVPQYIGSNDFGIFQNMIRQLILGAAEIFPPVDEEFPGEEGSGESSPLPSRDSREGSEGKGTQDNGVGVAGPSGYNGGGEGIAR